ncbi:DUF5693 family protein [Defluviitalea saccharophila]|uniref:DUF5693 family protein n=1 Tax=Defluviitalea saccharophila TaxID=879970 RepID=A0ABZ2Y023_9FIRM
MKKKLGLLPAIIVIVSLILSGIQGVIRFSTEKNQKEVEILANYSDIKKAAETYEESIETVTQKLKDAGVTGVLIKEQTIKTAVPGSMTSWEEQGEVTAFTGAELKILGMMDGIDLATIIPSHYYIWISDDSVRNTIKEHLGYKLGEYDEITINNEVFLDAGVSNNAILTLGTGYPMDDLKIIADQGLTISPQIRSWTNVTEEALAYVLKDVESIPNLGTVYFNDATVPGYDMPLMLEFAQNHKVGIIEFFSEKQKGLYTLIRKASHGGEDFNTIRLHTMTDGETSTLTPDQVVDRYLLAATERNLKALLVKMPNSGEPQKDFADWFKIVEDIRKELGQKGYTVGANPKAINIPVANPFIIWFIGFGPIFLLVLFGRWMDKEKWSWILVLGGLFVWTGLLKLRPILARQLMALAASILYPTWAVVTSIDQEHRSWKEAIVTFLKICFISLGGALTIIGLLSQTSSVLTIDMFRGAKVAHVIPLVLVLLLLEYKRGGLEVHKIKKFLRNPITYLTLVVVGILGIALIIYVQRTGNTGQTSAYEVMFRNALRKILGVRPRTKEFLIGHPLMLMMLYYGYKEKYFPLLLGAVIGQISLVNTYAHIHTPIMISLIRSFHGIWIGIIGGVILILMVNWIIKLGRRWNLWEE